MHTKQKLKCVNNNLNEHISTLKLLDKNLKNRIIKASSIIIESLKKGGTIVEATAGNTGIAIAIIAIKRGYKVIIVVPNKMTVEKVYHLRQVKFALQIYMEKLGVKIFLIF